jgi:hypothetical protein
MLEYLYIVILKIVYPHFEIHLRRKRRKCLLNMKE